MEGSLLTPDASTAEPVGRPFIVDWEDIGAGKQVLTCLICVPDVRRCRLDLVAKVLPRSVKRIQTGAIIHQNTIAFVDARGSLGCLLKNALSQAWPWHLEEFEGTKRQSLHSLWTF